MAVDRDSALEECLAARARGEPLDSCLSRLPAGMREEIEPLVRLVESLQQAERPRLPAATTAFQEQRLLAQATLLRSGAAAGNASLAPDGRISTLAPSGRAWRWLAAAVTLFLLMGSLVLGAGATALISNAAPDDALYTWKLSWEQTQLLLSGTDAQRARVFVAMAQNRIAEVEQLARQGRPIPEELLLQVRLSVNQAIALTANLSGREAVAILRELSELLAYERLLLTRFLATLPEPERASVELELATIQESEQTVTRALESQLPQVEPAPTATALPATDAEPSATAAPAGAEPPAPALAQAELGTWTTSPTTDQAVADPAFDPPVDLPPVSPADPPAGDGRGQELPTVEEAAAPSAPLPAVEDPAAPAEAAAAPHERLERVRTVPDDRPAGNRSAAFRAPSAPAVSPGQTGATEPAPEPAPLVSGEETPPDGGSVNPGAPSEHEAESNSPAQQDHAAGNQSVPPDHSNNGSGGPPDHANGGGPAEPGVQEANSGSNNGGQGQGNGQSSGERGGGSGQGEDRGGGNQDRGGDRRNSDKSSKDKESNDKDSSSNKASGGKEKNEGDSSSSDKGSKQGDSSKGKDSGSKKGDSGGKKSDSGSKDKPKN